MSQLQFANLLMTWILSVIFIGSLIWFEFRRAKFTFGILFSVLFLAIFYFGFPISSTLMFYFDAQASEPEVFIQALLLTTCFYGIYYIVYKTNLKFISNGVTFFRLFNVNRFEINLTWMILMGIALVSLVTFFLKNGFLLFKLRSYYQISSAGVFGVVLKRFFYFFIPSTLIIYFLRQGIRRWIFFFLSTMGFGLLTYIIVGGTRANLIISFLIFLSIGITRNWISPRYLIMAIVLEVVAMFYLAEKRYGIDIKSNDEIFYTFLFFTRDTFSPWENLALLLQRYDQIDFQWIAPIMRNFYTFIPRWLWENRPETVLNTANYFTQKILKNCSGLAISPTLVGSLLIMGGVLSVLLGAVFVGLIIKFFDKLYFTGIKEKNRYKAALLQSFCFSTIFSIVVLIREGLDAFVSHVVFFIFVFTICLFLAKLLSWLFNKISLIISV